MESTRGTSSCVTLRDFRELQKRDISSCRALTEQDRTVAISKDARLAMEALGARDAIEIVRLVGRLVGYLESPRRQGDSRVHSVSVDVASEKDFTGISCRHIGPSQLRHVILCLLGVVDERGLDTNDVGTRKLLKIPFSHIASLLKTHRLDRLTGKEQWIEFSRVASGLDVGPDPQVALSGIVKWPHQPFLKNSERARVFGNYEPNTRVKTCSTVLHDVSEPKVLKCFKCPYTITSSWYFVHPKTGKRGVLVPHNGHMACRKGSLLAPYRPADGSPCRLDKLANIAFCHHTTLPHACRHCNPSAFCSHGRRRSHCQVCGICCLKRRRTSRTCAVVGAKVEPSLSLGRGYMCSCWSES
mmetsp:Transcript_30266/g.96454  ORF Transcript_30266/g.96454 Transcript_30266/m.96454 type:complete len:357 (+) Transcript_30266:202-1272(+)